MIDDGPLYANTDSAIQEQVDEEAPIYGKRGMTHFDITYHQTFLVAVIMESSLGRSALNNYFVQLKSLPCQRISSLFRLPISETSLKF